MIHSENVNPTPEPMTDAELLNDIGWRLGLALGYVKPGDGRFTTDISGLVDEACARITGGQA